MPLKSRPSSSCRRLLTLLVLSLCGVAGSGHVSLAQQTEKSPAEKEAQPVRTFKALDYADNTVEQNKVLAIPALRASRATKTQVGRINDVLVWPGGDLVKRDLDCRVEGTLQWASNLHKKKLAYRDGSYTWDNISIQPGPAGARALKWGAREYNAPDRIFKNCDFTDITQEHGLYCSNYADTTLQSCTFLRCGSQGAQWAHRSLPYQQYNADCMPYAKKPLHIVRDSHFVDCGFEGMRPSYNLTYFSPGSSEMPGTLIIEDSSFVGKWPKQRRDGRWSTGALVVTPMQGGPPLSPTVGQMMERVVLRNCLFDYTAGDRPIANIKSTNEVLIENCCFIARDHSQGKISIDHEWPNTLRLKGTKTQRIVVRNTISRGARLTVYLKPREDQSQEKIDIDIHCPGEEIVVSGVTGKIISRRPWTAESK